MDDEYTVRLTLRIPLELHASVKKSARKTGLSMNSYITNALHRATSRVDVPLSVVETDEGDFAYMLPVPESYFALVKCGEPDATGDVFYCPDCHREKVKEIKGCGKTINLTI